MVGTIDSKGIREIKAVQTVSAYAASGASEGEPSTLTASTTGEFFATPSHVSATTNLLIPGRWGIAAEDITSGAKGKYIVAGVATALDTATSGYMVIALSANGSILASAAISSGSSKQGIGLYASSLLSAAGGILIY